MVRAYCALYAAIMIMGVAGDKVVIDRFAPASEGSDVPMPFRRHLLKLYALTAIMVLVTNEATLALDMPLGMRVVTLSLLPLVLHYVFEITMHLTAPVFEDDSSAYLKLSANRSRSRFF